MSEKHIENDTQGNGKVPMSVLDRFMELNTANNKAYSEIVAVLETLSANVLAMRDSVSGLNDQIAGEQLAEVMRMCTDNIQTQVETVTELVATINDSGIIKAVGDCLKVNSVEDTEFARSILDHLQSPMSKQDNLDVVNWILSTAAGIKRNWGKLMVVFGATLAFIYLNGGKAIIDLITKLK